MRSAYAWSVVGLLWACNPQGSTQSPEPSPATEPTAAVGVAGDSAGDGAEAPERDEGSPTVATAEASSSEGGAGSSGDGGSEAGTTDDPAGTEPAPTDDAGDPEASPGDPKTKPRAKPTADATATLSLPRPIHGTVDSKCGKDPGVGKPLEAFSLPVAGKEGETITQGTYRGRVLVVNFWGTWCKPCLKELPEFDQLYRRYRKHGMTLLAIATDEEAEGVLEFANKRKLAAKLAIAGQDYAAKYGSPNFPFTFVIDYKGVIQASYRGYKPECLGALEADIREQLEVRAEAKAKRAKSKG